MAWLGEGDATELNWRRRDFGDFAILNKHAAVLNGCLAVEDAHVFEHERAHTNRRVVIGEEMGLRSDLVSCENAATDVYALPCYCGRDYKHILGSLCVLQS